MSTIRLLDLSLLNPDGTAESVAGTRQQPGPASPRQDSLQGRETVLSVLPGSDDHQRVQLVLRSSKDGTCLLLRQESWGSGVGWFTQSTVELDPDQIAALRSVLGAQLPSRSRLRAPSSSALQDRCG